MNIIEFAKTTLGKHLFDYEVIKLLDYEELMSWSSFTEWIRPKKVENQHLYNIWTKYQEYRICTLDIVQN